MSAEFAHAWLSLNVVIPLSPEFFGTKSENLLCTVRGRKLWLRYCFEDDVMVVMVDAMVLPWCFCLFFGKYQNDLTFSGTFNFSSGLIVQGIIVILNHLGVISSEVDGIWWHQKFILNISFKRWFKGDQNATKKIWPKNQFLSSYFYFNFLKSVGKLTVLFNQWEKSLPFLFCCFVWNT